MTLKTRPCRLKLLNRDGTALPGARVRAQLTVYQVDGADVVKLVWPLVEETGAPGYYSGPLWPNTRGDGTSQYLITADAGELRMAAGLYTVPDGAATAAVAISMMVNAQPWPPVYQAAAEVDAARVFSEAAGTSAGRAAAAKADAETLAGVAQQAVSDALPLAVRAEAARDLALDGVAQALASTYSTIAEGRADTADGGYFKVLPGGSDGLKRLTFFKAVAGSQVEVATYPSGQEVDELGLAQAAEYQQTGGKSYGALALAMLDDVGTLALGITVEGDAVLPRVVSDEVVDGGREGDHYNYDFAVADEQGNVLFGFLNGQLLGVDVEASLVGALESYALALRIAAPPGIDGAALVWDYNHVIGNGQSLMQAMEAWPALSVTQQFGNLMFGSSVRPSSPAGAAFDPVGGAALQPLKATNQDSGTGSLLSDSATAALAAGNTAFGESPVEALANGLKRLFNDARHTVNDARALVVSNVAVSGRTVEQLSKGANPSLYTRFLQAISGVKALADAAGKSYGVAVVALAQGEWNYVATYGGDTTQAGYQARFLQWVSDMASDAKSITGQTREPVFLTYQTGAGYARDDTNLSVGMAQWRATKARRNLFMAAPVYPVTDKGGHLDANGSRWLGAQFAKAAGWVLVHRRPWRPLEPVQIVADRSDIYVAFRVPCPPLRFDLPYVGNTATDWADKGFRVQDDGGAVAIKSVAIVSSSVVRLRLARAPVGAAYVWYASEATGGGGCLCDSDATQADDLYAYSAGSGQYASANIPALVGKPYPLANWAIAFRLQVGFKEAL